ncbi:gamma-glutamylcyclotransferase family protein [Synechococcus sp. HIMB2401]|uniref:gamma-glutamylcyclotransferase family protein n=1 Tax=Synechococcus sp. HIMB2401 TaxID=3144208 RepID=UPI0036F42009
MKRLFVYGSLKSKGSAHHLLKCAKRDRDGIVDDFIEIQHRGYPMLQRGNGAISGEVYQRSSVTLRDSRSLWLYEAAPRIN